MINKKNVRLKRALAVASVLTILAGGPATKVLASSNTGNAIVENEVTVDNHQKAEQLVKEVVAKADNIIVTKNVREMNNIIDELVQLRRNMVKRMGISTEDSLVNQVKDKTQALRDRAREVIQNKVEKEQQRLSNTYKNATTIPLVENPNWYNEGLPEEVKVREVESIPENVIIDVVAQEDKELKGDGLFYAANPIDVMGKDYYSHTPMQLVLLSDTAGRGDIKGYLDKNGNFYEKPEALPSGYFKSGEVMFSVVVDGNSPMVKGTKVINRSYWKRCKAASLGENESTNLTKTTTYGVNNSEAISIAKTTGTNFSINGDLGASNIGSGKVGINYSVENSLTKTFNRTISISNSVTDSIRHVFEKNGKNRKVGLYQFVERFEQVPKSEYNIHYDTTNFEMAQRYAEDKKIKLVFNRRSQLNTSEFTSVDIEEGQTSIHSVR
ncbi:hypothetical protein [Clostridium oceanicum]|uniref:Uncharacterized protein n=1 Tax=Clostridium oceanicum TaxID=1543 RepID=A0ABN1J9F8_9CLOT